MSDRRESPIDDDALDGWLRLAALPMRDVAALDTLTALPGGLGALRHQSDTELQNAGLDERLIARLRTAAPDTTAVRRWLDGERHTLVTWRSPQYPALLTRIPDPPALLYALGDPDLLGLPLLAVVGSRKPTRGGEETARLFCAAFCQMGLGVVSGLALGIDASAHAAALDAGGTTVAVLGTGIDRVYPAANQALATRIAGAGCIITEFPLGSEARREHFPQRNRLISGLALGTLVIEAALRSGSLITARLAAEQGREVFAVPGSIRNPMARGCHRLIRDGARLVESVDDVIAELGVMTETLKNESTEDDFAEPRALNPAHRKLLDALGFEPCAVDEIATRTALTIAEVSSMLLILELEGRVESLPGGRYARLQ
ncbi:MAG: DNA-processing protein DprA [Pseudomonadota bacterium]